MASSTDNHRRIIEALLGQSVTGIDEFYQAIGRFVLAYAKAEAQLQSAFWHLANVPSDIAKAVFSGVKMDAAIGLIKRIGEVQRWPTERVADFEAFTHQFGEITKLRNEILHYGAEVHGPEEWLVSNSRIAHIPERIRETVVSRTILDEATEDLRTIDAHLIVFAYGEFLSGKARLAYGAMTQTPWRYKPRAQGAPQKKTRNKPPKRKAPPRSSQG